MENPIAVADSRYGRFLFFRNDDPIGACLHHYGEWAQQEMDLFDQILTENSNVIDVGANIGTHSVYFSKKCRNGTVFPIEPQLYISELLGTNLLLNGCFNAIPTRAACGSEKKQLRLMNINPFHGTKVNYGEYKVNNSAEKGIFTECITLDSFCDVGVPFDLIKLDVEGLEVDVLNGASKIIESYKPKLYIEFNSKEGKNDLLEKIYSLDYIPYWHVYTKHNPNNFNNKAQNVWEPSGNIISKENLDVTYEGNILCVHKSQVQPQGMTQAKKGTSIYDYLLDCGLI